MPVEEGLPWHPVATGLAGQAVLFIVAAPMRTLCHPLHSGSLFPLCWLPLLPCCAPPPCLLCSPLCPSWCGSRVLCVCVAPPPPSGTPTSGNARWHMQPCTTGPTSSWNADAGVTPNCPPGAPSRHPQRVHNLGPLLHAIALGFPLRDPRRILTPFDMRWAHHVQVLRAIFRSTVNNFCCSPHYAALIRSMQSTNPTEARQTFSPALWAEVSVHQPVHRKLLGQAGGRFTPPLKQKKNSAVQWQINLSSLILMQPPFASERDVSCHSASHFSMTTCEINREDCDLSSATEA